MISKMEDAAMRTFRHFCREHGITRRRALWLGLVMFGDDLVVLTILAVSHYLHPGSGIGM